MDTLKSGNIKGNKYNKISNNKRSSNIFLKHISLLFYLLFFDLIMFFFDDKIIYFIYDFKLKYNLFRFDYIIANLFSLKFLVIIIGIFFIYILIYKRKNLIFFLNNIIITTLLSLALKLFTHRIRPLEMFERFNFSFPSSHTSMAFALAFGLIPIIPKNYRIVFFIYAIIMGLSRIWVLRHYPTDVISGIIVAFYVFVLLYDKKLK